jgi:hypothetical protein
MRISAFAGTVLGTLAFFGLSQTALSQQRFSGARGGAVHSGFTTVKAGGGFFGRPFRPRAGFHAGRPFRPFPFRPGFRPGFDRGFGGVPLYLDGGGYWSYGGWDQASAPVDPGFLPAGLAPGYGIQSFYDIPATAGIREARPGQAVLVVLNPPANAPLQSGEQGQAPRPSGPRIVTVPDGDGGPGPEETFGAKIIHLDVPVGGRP